MLRMSQLVIYKPKSKSVTGDRLVQELSGPWVGGGFQ